MAGRSGAVKLLATWLLASLAVGCATTPSGPAAVSSLLEQGVAAANYHLARQEPIETIQLLDAVAAIDAEYPGLQAARQRVGAETPAGMADAFQPSLLGVNRLARYPVERTTGEKVLLYVPDRLVDLLDCVTFEFNFGPGIYLNYHATRAVQLGGGGRAVVGFGTYGARSIIGVRGHSEASTSVLMLGGEAQAGALASLAGIATGTHVLAGVHSPSNPYYQTYADYWEVGAATSLLYFGADWGVHPLQVGDFFAGFAMVDFLRDDWATSRSMKLSGEERELVRQLVSVGRSEEERARYTKWSRAQRAAETPPPQP